VTKADAPVQGMLAIVIFQSGLSLMTISPSLNSQFNVLVNLAVVTNIIPYILSMAALVIIQKVAKVDPRKARAANIVALIGAIYSFYALYSSGQEAMLYGAMVTFMGWTLYGLVSPRFELKNKHSCKKNGPMGCRFYPTLPVVGRVRASARTQTALTRFSALR
jgi:putrescine:ornithine antiporter